MGRMKAFPQVFLPLMKYSTTKMRPMFRLLKGHSDCFLSPLQNMKLLWKDLNSTQKFMIPPTRKKPRRKREVIGKRKAFEAYSILFS